MRHALTISFLFLGLVAARPAFAAETVTAAKSSLALSVIRVNATVQPYDFVRPWNKKSPYTWRALGAVVAGKRVLVTAEAVANWTYVELEKAESGDKVPATVECMDFEANLALLKPADEKFLDGFRSFELAPAVVGDRLALLQLESNAALVSTEGLLTTAVVTRYADDDTSLLVYRLTSALQTRDGSITLPVVKGDRLAGMMMRYNRQSQNVDVIAAPVIEHFLKDAARKPYRGFPRAGVAAAATRDPQLRRYAGLNGEHPGGVYVTDVPKNSPAAAAGVQEGDIILAIDGQPIDQDGNYADPLYGKISFAHLTSTRHYDGDAVTFKILRAGHAQDVKVALQHRAAGDFVVEPYSIGQAPPYHVLGGLVLLELSRQYLKEWGDDWARKAPRRFVYLDRFQSELFPGERRRIVILSQVMPSPCTIGYENLSSAVVAKINGVAIRSLADVTAAVARPIGGFHKIELEENPREIYLDAAEAKQIEPALLRNYGLPAIKR